MTIYVTAAARPSVMIAKTPTPNAVRGAITYRKITVANGISKRRAIQILRAAGYRLASTNKHELWTDGAHTIALPLNTNSDLWGFMAQQIKRVGQTGATPPKAKKHG